MNKKTTTNKPKPINHHILSCYYYYYHHIRSRHRTSTSSPIFRRIIPTFFWLQHSLIGTAPTAAASSGFLLDLELILNNDKPTANHKPEILTGTVPKSQVRERTASPFLRTGIVTPRRGAKILQQRQQLLQQINDNRTLPERENSLDDFSHNYYLVVTHNNTGTWFTEYIRQNNTTNEPLFFHYYYYYYSRIRHCLPLFQSHHYHYQHLVYHTLFSLTHLLVREVEQLRYLFYN